MRAAFAPCSLVGTGAAAFYSPARRVRREVPFVRYCAEKRERSSGKARHCGLSCSLAFLLRWLSCFSPPGHGG